MGAWFRTSLRNPVSPNWHCPHQFGTLTDHLRRAVLLAGCAFLEVRRFLGGGEWAGGQCKCGEEAAFAGARVQRRMGLADEWVRGPH
jgi:hypothetical protein